MSQYSTFAPMPWGLLPTTEIKTRQTHLYILRTFYKHNCSQGRPKDSLYNSYNWSTSLILDPYPLCQWTSTLGIMERMSANGLGDWGSIPVCVTPKKKKKKKKKKVLDASLLNTQHYKVWIKGKWRDPEKGVVPSPTPWCSSYWEGAFGSPSTMVGQLK